MIDIKKSTLSCFILPLLSINTSLIKNNLNKCYLYKMDNEDLVALVFQEDIEIELIERLELIPYFLTSFESNSYMIFLFEIPREFKKDLELLKIGKYSFISNEAKYKILQASLSEENFKNLDKMKSTRLYGILFKTKILRKHWEETLGVEINKENELWEMPDMEKEYIKLKLT